MIKKVLAIALLICFVAAACGPKPECKTKAGKKKKKMFEKSLYGK